MRGRWSKFWRRLIKRFHTSWNLGRETLEVNLEITGDLEEEAEVAAVEAAATEEVDLGTPTEEVEDSTIGSAVAVDAAAEEVVDVAATKEIVIIIDLLTEAFKIITVTVTA